ncbi:MAG TPA: universal stress protein [Phycisphaerae bacterium]|nr:universal stress protein [Phycisphaerae bacterium]HRR86870.1 universal stress protein [Phycisphaerae bacterium]
MERFQRILVCIETLEKARGLLGYASAVSRAVQAREVHLLHVQSPAATRPKAVVNGVAIARRGITTSILRDAAAEIFRGHGREKVQCSVAGGVPLIEILRSARNRDVDLIILGRRGGEHSGSSLPSRVATKARCSVLVVSDGSEADWKRILVPARKSECSAHAFATACDMGAATGAEVLCLNVYPVRSGYLNVGTSLDEHAALLGDWARHECEELRDNVNSSGANVRIKCVPDFYRKPVAIMLDQVAGEHADLLVIGAQGRRGIAGLLLGAVADKMIRQSDIPVLAVKKKGEAVGLACALRTLAG